MPSSRPEIELFRLEQRYTRRRGREGFTSEAQYVDGEYIYSHRHPPGKGAVKARSREVPTSVGRMGHKER